MKTHDEGSASGHSQHICLELPRFFLAYRFGLPARADRVIAIWMEPWQ